MPSVDRGNLRRFACVALLVAGAVLLPPLHAGATPLGLTETSPGDVTTFSIDVEYNSNTGVLTANGSGDDNFYQVLDGNGYFYPNTFSITANLNPANGALVSGTIDVEGTEYFTIDNSPLLYSGVLLTGNLTAFGFPSASNTTNNPLEFEFHVTGGALTASDGPYFGYSLGGTILHLITNSNINFAAGWPQANFSDSSNVDNTSADTFPVAGNFVPEPSAFVLFVLGMLPLAWRLRRRGYTPA